MTIEELRLIGDKLRRGARGEMLDYLDGTLPLLVRPALAPRAGVGEAARHFDKLNEERCPVCAERRRRKALSQKKWRKSRANPFK